MIERIISATVLILLLMLVRFLFRRRLSQRVMYALWGLAALRLLIPFSLPVSPFGMERIGWGRLDDMFVGAAMVRDSQGETADSLKGSGDSEGETADSGGKPADGTADSEGKPVGEPVSDLYTDASGEKNNFADGLAGLKGSRLLSAALLLQAVWIVGVDFVGAAILVFHLVFVRRLHRMAVPYGVKGYPLPVYLAEGLPSPCLVGVFRPAVYLNGEAAADTPKLEHILAHELTHYRHKDHFWAAVRCLCICLYWFHPLVWAASALSRRDCELACDEGTLKRLPENLRLAYGRTLLSMAAAPAKTFDLLCAGTAMNSGKKAMRERIIEIAQGRTHPKGVLVFVLLMAMLTAGCAFTGGSGENRREEEDIRQTQGTENGLDETGGQTEAGQSTTELGETREREVGQPGDGQGEVKQPGTGEGETGQDGTGQGGTAPDRTYGASGEIAVNGNNSWDEWEGYTWYKYFTALATIPDSYEEDTPEISERDGLSGLVEPWEQEGSGWDVRELEQAVHQSIMSHNQHSFLEGMFRTEAHKLLLLDNSLDGTIVVYAMVVYQEFRYEDGVFAVCSGSSGPAVLSITQDGSGVYGMGENGYWTPGDGAYYMSSIKENLPENVQSALFKNQSGWSEELSRQCEANARGWLQKQNMQPELREPEELFQIIADTPSVESGILPYFEAHREETRDLILNGDRTLEYIAKAFSAGSQTGLQGVLMLPVLQFLLGGESLKCTADTPQEWFDFFLSHCRELEGKNEEGFMEKYYPRSWIILESLR